MASRNATEREPEPADETVRRHRFAGVLRARRMEAARTAGKRAQEELICADEYETGANRGRHDRFTSRSR